VDESEALKYSGVKAFISAKDIPVSDQSHGDPNIIGPVFKDEELFATKEVHFVGQMIGMIIADTERNARAASKLVKIEYEPLPFNLTIEVNSFLIHKCVFINRHQDSIKNNSFFPLTREIKRGHFATNKDPMDVPISSATHWVEGVARIAPQEHFYFETNCSLAVPKLEDDEFEVFSSCQHPSETQVILLLFNLS
jgi:xanthine dehydrogenase/oxidase